MSPNTHKITPIGIITALLIIGVLAAVAIPRFREASAPPKEARVLAVFGGDVKDSVGGVAVSCASCGDGLSPR